MPYVNRCVGGIGCCPPWIHAVPIKLNRPYWKEGDLVSRSGEWPASHLLFSYQEIRTTSINSRQIGQSQKSRVLLIFTLFSDVNFTPTNKFSLFYRIQTLDFTYTVGSIESPQPADRAGRLVRCLELVVEENPTFFRFRDGHGDTKIHQASNDYRVPFSPSALEVNVASRPLNILARDRSCDLLELESYSKDRGGWKKKLHLNPAWISSSKLGGDGCWQR